MTHRARGPSSVAGLSELIESADHPAAMPATSPRTPSSASEGALRYDRIDGEAQWARNTRPVDHRCAHHDAGAAREVTTIGRRRCDVLGDGVSTTVRR